MTTYGTTAKLIGMYIEKYTDYAVSGHNCDFRYEESEFTRHIIVAKSDLGKYLTFTLSYSMGECGSGWSVATNGNLEIEVVNDDVIEKITHFPTDDYDHLSWNCDERDLDDIFHIDLKTISSFENEFDCFFFNISNFGYDSYYPTGNYHVYEDCFVDFDIRKAKKEFIDTISDELLSVVWSPENIPHFADLGSDVDFSAFADFSKFIKA